MVMMLAPAAKKPVSVSRNSITYISIQYVALLIRPGSVSPLVSGTLEFDAAISQDCVMSAANWYGVGRVCLNPLASKAAVLCVVEKLLKRDKTCREYYYFSYEWLG